MIEKLAQPRALFGIALLSLVLLSPCLATRMLLDDHVLAVKAGVGDPVAGLPRDPFALFTFTTGDSARNRSLMDEGVLLPWWSEPHHLNAFFRPLSALTHLIDFRLWPTSARLMHAHSMLWFSLLLVALAFVYRTLEPSAPALTGFALLLYAIDDAHGATVGWISNRNAIVSACLALPTIAFHRRWVDGSRSSGVLAFACLFVGLCAGETALCIVGYLLAYALCLDSRSMRTRLLSLSPYIALLVAHRALYHALGLGSFGSSAYHDPLREPIAFARMLGYNLPVLLSAELFVPVADFAFWGDVSGRPVLFAWSAASVIAIGWLAWSLLRRDPQARFWCVGMLLAAVPISASLPGERLLLAVGFGGAALLARLLLALWEARPAMSGTRRFATDLLVLLHLVVAPLSLPLRAYALEPLARATDRLDRGFPRDRSIGDKTLVVLNAPIDVLISYLQVSRAARSIPRPAHVYWLSSSSSETRVRRSDPHTLEIEQARGFLLRPEETHYRADPSTLSEVSLSEMRARVVDRLGDGRPRTVAFRFREALESPHYLFRIYRDGALVAVPAAISGGLSLPAQDFFQLVALEAFR